MKTALLASKRERARRGSAMRRRVVSILTGTHLTPAQLERRALRFYRRSDWSALAACVETLCSVERKLAA